MKIQFCDLCNESVPQSDLDEGRAFMRKGRVVCGKCDQLMTQREQGASGPMASSASSAAFGSGASAAGAQATLTPLAAPAHEPPHASHHPHTYTALARSQRSNSGLAVALFSMALTAGAFYWVTERTDRMSLATDQRQKQIESAQHEADQRAMDRSMELEAKFLAMEERLKLENENALKANNSAIDAASRKHAEALASFGDLRSSIAELKAVMPTVQRHDAELLESARKLTAVESRAAALDLALGELKKQLELRPGPAAPVAAPATPVGTPAWMGLVKDLESANNGDRWVAVSGLGETRDPAVAEYLLPRLKDVDIFVRMATARVLGDLKSPKAIGALIDALNDQDSSVREAAYVSLCSITAKSFPFEAHQEQAERAKKVKVWQDWWKKSQEEGAAQ